MLIKYCCISGGVAIVLSCTFTMLISNVTQLLVMHIYQNITTLHLSSDSIENGIVKIDIVFPVEKRFDIAFICSCLIHESDNV